MKAKLLKLCVVCIMAFTSAGFAEIHQISKAEDIRKHAEDSDLAVFDIDMVLIQPSEPAFQMVNIYQHGKKFKEIIEELEPLEKDIFFNLMVTSGESSLVDDQMIPLLQHLKANNIKTIALTAGLTGSFEKISSMEEWRCDRLKQLGIDFSESFPSHNEMVLTELPLYRNNYATFKKGVLFANGEKNPTGKGLTLKKFLEQLNFKPQKIVFIDDRLENLHIVEEVLKADPSISFTGLHYTGAKHFPSEKVDPVTFEKKYMEIAKKAKVHKP